MSVLTVVLASVLAVGTVAGCSSEDPPGASEHGSDLPSAEELAAYFDAVASYDPAQLADAEEAAADGSPAQGYAAYLADFATSAEAAGQPVDPAAAHEVDGGFEACGGTGAADECVTWADLVGRDGELADFTVDGTRLDESLVDLTAQAPVVSEGLYTVQPDYAYRSPQSGSLFVLVTVTARDVALAPRPGVYIEQDHTLDGVETRAPARVEPGASTPVVLAFPDAEDVALDGAVTFPMRVGESEESIGFGLADPAA
jgi:hypothetical protein